MIPMLKLTVLFAAAAAMTFAADSDVVARGKYLVEEVGKCQECHTPRTQTGEFDKSNWLKGATLDFSPMHEVPGWHKTSPDITGGSRLFQRWGDEGMTKFFQTGLGPRGNKADPPMPAYTLKEEDAKAIVAYLKSLK